MSGLFDNSWVDINSALKISTKYPKGCYTKAALISAGKKCNFARKNGYHWEFNAGILSRYCEISNKPTLQSLAEELHTSKGSIKYFCLKHNINFHKEMGRKFLTEIDAQRIINEYPKKQNNS